MPSHKDFDAYRFYQCIEARTPHPQQYACVRVVEGYIPLDASRLVCVPKILPAFLDKYVLTGVLLPSVTISKGMKN